MSRSQRVYDLLLRLYPSHFRLRYADEMVQLFGDQLRDARTSGGSSGAAATWFRALGDLVRNAVAERVRGGTGVAQSLDGPPPPVVRTLGLIGIAGGAVLVVVFVVDLAESLYPARIALFNLGAIAVVLGLRATADGRDSRAFNAATMAAGLANAAYLALMVIGIGRPQPPEADVDFRLIGFFAGVALWLTDAALGLVLLRLRGIARVGALALALGSPFALLGIDRFELVRNPAFGELVQTISLAGVALNGLGWILLGLTLALARRDESPAGSA